MHFLALAVDYDGTIAHNGSVSPEVQAALALLKNSGRKLLLVTGRELQALKHNFPQLALFDRVIAENGAVLYDPMTDMDELITDSASTELVRCLREKGVAPLSVGRSVIATWHPFEEAVINSIRDLGLELQMTFNKDAIMVLPPGVNKAFGLRAALRSLGICEQNVVGVGDAENDHSFLSICGCSAAVSNAIASIKSCVDIRLEHDHGQGVIELVDLLLHKDCALVPVDRVGMHLGQGDNARDLWLPPDSILLIVGNSGAGKSSYVTWLTERMVQAHQGFCIVDPEGDYLNLKDAVTIGGLTAPPTTEESVHHLLRAELNVVVSALALNAEERIQLFGDLLPFLQALRKASGRPYWLILDEAHYMLPHCAVWPSGFLGNMGAVIVALDFEQVCPTVLDGVDVLLTLGSTSRHLIEQFARLRQRSCPSFPERTQSLEYACVWDLHDDREVVILDAVRPQQKHHRHSGKYVAGDVGPWHAFYFPALGKYAGNLRDFLRLSSLLDDAGLHHHLAAYDFSRWFREVIRDDVLAKQTSLIESDSQLTGENAMGQIARLVQSRYHL
jgi:HAD superfamily hydrolase (TIGR01484 family)